MKSRDRPVYARTSLRLRQSRMRSHGGPREREIPAYARMTGAWRWMAAQIATSLAVLVPRNDKGGLRRSRMRSHTDRGDERKRPERHSCEGRNLSP